MAEQTGSESIGQNVRALLSQAERLARTEMELAVAKGKDALGNQARHVTMLIVAGLLGFGGTAYLLFAVYSGLTARLESWVAALITAGVAFASAFVCLKLAVTSETSSESSRSSHARGVSAR